MLAEADCCTGDDGGKPCPFCHLHWRCLNLTGWRPQRWDKHCVRVSDPLHGSADGGIFHRRCIHGSRSFFLRTPIFPEALPSLFHSLPRTRCHLTPPAVFLSSNVKWTRLLSLIPSTFLFHRPTLPSLPFFTSAVIYHRLYHNYGSQFFVPSFFFLSSASDCISDPTRTKAIKSSLSTPAFPQPHPSLLFAPLVSILQLHSFFFSDAASPVSQILFPKCHAALVVVRSACFFNLYLELSVYLSQSARSS